MQNKTQFFKYDNLLEFMYLKHENTDLYLVHCGLQQCPPGHHYEKRRQEYHVHFVLEGCGILHYRGKLYQLKRGDIFVILPDTEYQYEADQETPWRYAWVGFNGTQARQYLAQSGMDADHVVRPCYLEPEVFTDHIYQILLCSQLTVANELQRLGYLYQVIALLMESNPNRVRENGKDYQREIYIEHALEYIENHYQDPIHVNDIVNCLGINRSYFSALFKQEMQISPLSYLQNIRIRQAKSLLKKTNLTLQEIAVSVGCNDAFTFSKLFKRITGLSPSDYRSAPL